MQQSAMFPEFDGKTYSPEQDGERLRAQLQRVRAVVSDGRWRTLMLISSLTGYPEASISARLRDLRKAKFGGHTVERRRVRSANGLFEYRFIERVAT